LQTKNIREKLNFFVLIQTEGEGNGKKLSKKKAAEKMVDELKKLPPPSPVEDVPRANIKMRRKQQQQQQVVSNFQTKSQIRNFSHLF
jgi:hypothetical protein